MRKLVVAIALALTTFTSFTPIAKVTHFSVKEARCLADNVYYEARGEPERGRVLVARVTLNRAYQEQESICQTVYKKNQFSWTNLSLKQPDRKSDLYYQSWVAAHKAVYTIHPATFFHATYVKPSWARKRIKVEQVGSHVFYY